MFFEEDEVSSREQFLLDFISHERRNKIMRYKQKIDRKLALYSALIVRMGLKEITSYDTGSFSFGIGKYGKPFVIDHDVLFNISHTKKVIICAFLNVEIGVDIENTCDRIPFDIMNSYFCSSEIRLINNLEESQKGDAFLEIWTKKEAFFKKLGTGVSSQFAGFNSLNLTIEKCICEKKNKYIFAVCADELEVSPIQQLSLDDICKYFLNMERYVSEFFDQINEVDG